MIPTVALSEVPISPQLAPQLSADTLNAPNRALVGLGESISQVGSFLGRVAMDKQQHVNEGILAAEDLTRRKTLDAVQKYMMENQQAPEKWADFAKKTLNEYQQGRDKRAMEQGWGQSVKDADAMRLNSFVADAESNLDLQISKAQVVKSNAQKKANAQDLLSRGMIDEAMEQVQSMDLNEEQRQETTQKLFYGAVADYIANDPIGMAKILEEKTDDGRYAMFAQELNPTQRVQLMQTAKNAVGIMRAETVNGLLEREINGEVIPEDEIEGLLANDLITPQQAKQFLGKKKTTAAIAGSLLVEAQDYDVSQDPTKEKYVAIMGSLSQLPDEIKSAAVESMKTKFKDATKGKRDGTYAEAEKALNHLWQSGILGKYKIDGKDADESERKEMLESTQRWATINDSLRKLYKDKPDTTQEEAVKFINEQAQRHVITGAASYLIPQKKAADSIIQDLRAKFKIQIK